MEDKNDLICPACGSDFIITYYQRRAADEPPDKVKYCKSCPLDPQRLTLEEPPASIVRTYQDKAIPRRRLSTSRSNSRTRHSAKRSLHGIFVPRPSVIYRQTRLRFEGAAATSCLKEFQKNPYKATTEIGSVVSVTIRGVTKTATAYSSGVYSGRTLYTTNSAFVAPFVTRQVLEAIETIQTYNQETEECLLGLIYNLEPAIYDTSGYLHTNIDGSNPEILVDFDASDEMFEKCCINIVEAVFQQYGTEVSLKTMVDSRFISAMFTQSARAFDSPVAPTTGYSYMWKPDGERYWCAKLGCVWFFCKRLLSAKVVGWRMDTYLTTTTRAAPVLDLEVLIGHEPILIDVLADQEGNLTPPMRNLPAILEIFSSLTHPPFGVRLRKQYPTLALLQSNEKVVEYPIDGAVGVEDSSTTIIKIKDVKSIELELTDTGALVASEGTIVATSNLHSIYIPGSIIEVRFRFQQDKSAMQVLSTLLRTDKKKANDALVCREIFSLAGSLPDAIARRKALLWCNSIRRELQRMASNVRGFGRVVLDVGSGDGQAVSDYSTDPDVTYLLVEPDSSKCIKLRKRLSERMGVRLQHTSDAAEVWRQISSLSRGTLKYLIFQGVLQSLLENPRSTTILKSCVRCCVASYSLSYVADSLTALAVEGLDILSCGYMYDKPVDGNCIVKASGVRMENKLNGTASVKWGSDREYLEPVLLTKKFEKLMSSVPAVAISPISTDKDEVLLRQIVASLFIVTTRRSL